MKQPRFDAASHAGFALRVMRWQRAHGRHHLPWQGTRDPYRVWLSEIMLQQTRVGAVTGYYARFLLRFPDVHTLAAAAQDEVLALWSGLGYYSRARNLHRCAQTVTLEYGGHFPRSAAQLRDLPGIGPSTAAAIAAFCFGERVAILDGNVKRVLARACGFEKDLAQPRHERELLDIATSLLPRQRLADTMPCYTQGLMDLGAMVCLAGNPQCAACPLRDLCIAQRSGDPQRLPVKTRKTRRSAQTWWLLFAQDARGRIWLQKRPQSGIWAGLYAPPVAAAPGGWALSTTLADASTWKLLPPVTHILTHRTLELHPVLVNAPANADLTGDGAWFDHQEAQALGLPAPVRKLLHQICFPEHPRH